MNDKDKRTLYISLFMIVVLSLISFWRLRSFDPSGVSLSFPESEKVSVPSFDRLFSGKGLNEILEDESLLHDEEKEEKEDVKYIRKTVEEKLVFDHPSSWIEVDISDQDSVEEIQVLLLYLSQSASSPTVLTIFRVDANETEEIIEIFKKALKDEGAKDFDTSVEKEDDKTYLLEMSYSHLGEVEAKSSSKLFLFEKDSYILSLTFFKEAPPSTDVIDYILSSAKKVNKSD